jgi:hypothetical protein
MKRWLFLIAVMLLIATVPIILWSTQPSGPINGYDFDRIQIGMTQGEVEQILGGPGDEGNGDGHSFPMSWMGRGRNVITVHFAYGLNRHVVRSKEFFNPGLLDRIKEWWGGYELHPGGGRYKRLEPAA